MNQPTITLTTDFGWADPYAVAMKGVILSINPAAHIVDLSHDLPAQDLVHGAYFLSGSVPYFPAEVLHVVVVDPGVGTDRKLLFVELDSHRLLLPDNGLITLLAERYRPTRLIELTERRYWREPVSTTFHGRDVLAPVAAHLSLGVEPGELGPPVHDWQRLPIPQPRYEEKAVHGEVVYVDRFGNLITNVSEIDARRLFRPRVLMGGQSLEIVSTYAQAPAGRCVALFSSSGFVEVAVVEGRACDLFDAGRGVAVSVVEV
jgi:hypothetical protein